MISTTSTKTATWEEIIGLYVEWRDIRMSSLSARSLKRFTLVHFVCDSHFLCVCASQTSYSNIGSTPNLRDHIVCVLGCCRCKTQLEVTSDCWRICIYTSGRSHPWNVSADNGTALICKAGRRVTRRPACRKISTSEMIWLSICSYFVATSASTSRDCNKVAGIFLVQYLVEVFCPEQKSTMCPCA